MRCLRNLTRGKAVVLVINVSSIFIFLCFCYIAFFNVQVKRHGLYEETASTSRKTLTSFKGNHDYMQTALQGKVEKQTNNPGLTFSTFTENEYSPLGAQDYLEQDSTPNSLKGVQQVSIPLTETVNSVSIQRLANDLKQKLDHVLPKQPIYSPPTCVKSESIKQSCDKGGCLRLELPKDPKSRIEQLVAPPHLHPNATYKKVLDDMRDSVPGNYDIIMVTAASENHYRESKALLYSLRTNVFPYLKNFTLIYYNLGLTSIQKEDITNICRCHVRDFPFERFPKMFTHLKCFTWKPIITYAHASRANLIYWMDASIRFYEDPSKTKEFLQLARDRGMQTGSTGNRIPRNTLRYMFHFFGDEACAYHWYMMCTSGNVAFHNEPLIHEAIIAPWAACALNETCMCPHRLVNVSTAIRCVPRSKDTSQYGYEQCHRFDQSALSIIARKVFQEKSQYIFQKHIDNFLTIKRGDLWRKGMPGFETDP